MAEQETSKSQVEKADAVDADEEDEAPLGFDPEQRRFLWTIVGVLVIGMLASVSLNIWYLQRQRTESLELTRATDDYRTAQQHFEQLQQQEVPYLVRLVVEHNEPAYEKARDAMVNFYREAREAYVTMRRDEGGQIAPVDPADIEKFGEALDAEVRHIAAGATSRPAPTTAPAATSAPSPAK